MQADRREAEARGSGEGEEEEAEARDRERAEAYHLPRSGTVPSERRVQGGTKGKRRGDGAEGERRQRGHRDEHRRLSRTELGEVAAAASGWFGEGRPYTA